jgi:hypothetical protein
VARTPIDADAFDRLVEEVPETRQLFGADPLIPDAWRRDRKVMELGLRLTGSLAAQVRSFQGRDSR